MAVYIKSIPPLRGKTAERFLNIAERNETQKRASVDFAKQAENARKILKNSKSYK